MNLMDSPHTAAVETDFGALDGGASLCAPDFGVLDGGASLFWPYKETIIGAALHGK